MVLNGSIRKGRFEGEMACKYLWMFSPIELENFDKNVKYNLDLIASYRG